VTNPISTAQKTQIKICGINTADALDAAIAAGATHVGYVFFAKSPRDLDAAQAAALSERADGRVKCVGLFVNPDNAFIDAVRAQVRLDIIQLHGEERPAAANMIRQRNGLELWKAISIRTRDDFAEAQKYRGSVDRILYDTKSPEGGNLPGGNGMPFDWKLLNGVSHPLPWGLAGGLHPGNVAEAIRSTGAPLVDTSSGVESAPGMKNVAKIAAFCKAVLHYEQARTDS
jgi:phosphoribosylanthranilate isomerase